MQYLRAKISCDISSSSQYIGSFQTKTRNNIEVHLSHWLGEEIKISVSGLVEVHRKLPRQIGYCVD